MEGAREPVASPDSLAPVGKLAFENALAKLSRHIIVGEDAAEAREAARSLSRARKSVESGDYLQAIQALGRIEVTLNPGRTNQETARFGAGEVEEALGEVKRTLANDWQGQGHKEAVLLWSAARQAVVDGQWEAAMAMLDEARVWAAQGAQ